MRGINGNYIARLVGEVLRIAILLLHSRHNKSHAACIGRCMISFVEMEWRKYTLAASKEPWALLPGLTSLSITTNASADSVG
jgi:hypothetical protein